MDYNETHRDIVEACMRHNRRAQFQLYQLYSKAMYNICLRMLNDVEDAEDLLQNSFMDVFNKLHYFRFESSIGAWIKRIVINNCINFLKKKRLQIVEMSDNDLNVFADKDTDNQNAGSATTDYQPEIQKVNQAIQQLPDGYRVVLTLYLLEGYDHQEIGEILGVSASTSKSQYSRARKKLQGILKEL